MISHLVLKRMEQYRALGKEKDKRTDITELIRTHGLDQLQNGVDKDRISHFILRLAFCANEEKRKWFMQQEAMLFQFRFEDASKSAGEMDAFFKENDVAFEEVSIDSVDVYN